MFTGGLVRDFGELADQFLEGEAHLVVIYLGGVEFDASKRAKLALVHAGIVDGGVANGPEGKGVDTMLDSAAWTYVAGFAASLLTLLYYVMMVAGMRRD